MEHFFKIIEGILLNKSLYVECRFILMQKRENVILKKSNFRQKLLFDLTFSSFNLVNVVDILEVVVVLYDVVVL